MLRGPCQAICRLADRPHRMELGMPFRACQTDCRVSPRRAALARALWRIVAAMGVAMGVGMGVASGLLATRPTTLMADEPRSEWQTPPNPEPLPNLWQDGGQAPIPGAARNGAVSPPNSVRQPNNEPNALPLVPGGQSGGEPSAAPADLSVAPTIQGPLTTDVPPDGPPPDGPPRQHPMLDRLRHFFGPEPNGNWDNEPLHFDTFLGFLDDRTAENTGVLGGFRFGWDYDPYWGIETRLGFTSLQEDTGPVVIWDESLLYYPWGDSRIRPYFTLGVGISEFKIVDSPDDWHHRENLVDMPFGIGFKYRVHEWLALRFDVLDNLAFGSGSLGTMNNFSFTTGFEWRFGGSHVNYWPWNPAPAR